MKNQKIRSMKVHEQSGYNYKATPTIILKGQWLKEMGFEIGDYITVSCEDGKLVITPDAEKAAMAKAEAEFMEKGMKKLQKRFQAEKEQLHAQFVAERNTEYIRIAPTCIYSCDYLCRVLNLCHNIGPPLFVLWYKSTESFRALHFHDSYVNSQSALSGYLLISVVVSNA